MDSFFILLQSIVTGLVHMLDLFIQLIIYILSFFLVLARILLSAFHLS